MNKSVADYVFEYLAAQDNALETDAELNITTDFNEDSFSDAELAATLNPERLHALLQACDRFLALAEQDIANFENIAAENVASADKKTDTSDKPAPVNNENV